MRFSRFIIDPQKVHQANAILTPGPRLIQNAFVSIDSIELSDLLRHDDSPFRVIAASSHPENSKRGAFSFAKFDLDKMSWQSNHMIESPDWGFQMSPSMESRRDAIRQLPRPNSYFDVSTNHQRQFLAVSSSLYDDGCRCVDVNVRHFTAQWNPSTVIALQRFLGRLKKASHSIFITTGADATTAIASEFEHVVLPSTIVSSPYSLIFSVNANIESIRIYLSELFSFTFHD